MAEPEVTRFAPSPTGDLHLGHAYAALFAHDAARATAGRFLVRMENLDQARCETRLEAGILSDLAWLGLAWDGPVRRQSDCMGAYRAALDALTALGVVYPCFCTRGAIAREIEAMAGAPQGPDGPLYPGTCRQLPAAERRARLAGGFAHALRLDVAAAIAGLAAPALRFEETGRGPAGENGPVAVQPALLGDIVLGRRDTGVSYHLAVVVDDADQGITLVTRGDDLFAATHVQRLLQALLGLPVPRYRHHPLIRDAQGRRLAKRDRDQTLASLRAAGLTPADIRRRLGLG
ncbi:MAG: tRNA glutamyl-Q(34) synthetase GluQRS [Gammaproteobacteria bacterium]|nr:tRNA glutamyl-Q(34) synthetase GluQRS [Gammaproteobacteria bacterium]